MKLAFSSNAFRNGSIEETIGILADIGYPGWVTIELYPFQEDSIDVAKKACAFIRPFLD